MKYYQLIDAESGEHAGVVKSTNPQIEKQWKQFNELDHPVLDHNNVDDFVEWMEQDPNDVTDTERIYMIEV